MKVAQNSYVTINYTLKDDDGNLLDTSVGNEPLSYIQGNNLILPKLEELILGKSAGDKFSTVLEPKDGYGERDERLVIKVGRENFDSSLPIEVGMKFRADTSAGPQIVKVTELTDDQITVDANHDLAGVRLHFNIEVLDVRDATQEELDSLLSGCGGCGGSCGDCGGGCGECGGGCGNCSDN